MGNFTRIGKKPKILVAPLDWGLGHATRCIPIIYELLNFSCEVIIAAERDQEQLLKGEFPKLRFATLEGYRIRYAGGRRLNRLYIGMQIPKIFMKIRKEKKWLARFITIEQPDVIISDNRYGLYADQIPSIFITHQLHIKTGFGKAIDNVLEKINHYYIRKFSACWIPDNAGPSSLAGSLSNPFSIRSVPTVMIGPISRFRACNEQRHEHILVLLSGPEPQRSILERKLLGLANFISGSIIMVRGLPLESQLPESPPNVKIHNHANTEQLNRWICGAEFVICRSGYTTIMDMMLLGKKSILIPTPGQTEQEYLAEWLSHKKLAYSSCQEDLNADILKEARAFNYAPFKPEGSNALRQVLDGLFQRIDEGRK